MSAFYSLIFLVIIAAISMAVVAYMNHKEENDLKRREKLRIYKLRLEELEDLVIAMDKLCDSRSIPRLVNEEIIELYTEMIELDLKAKYLQAGQSIAQTRAQELSEDSPDRLVTRLCHSDSQMAKMKHQCKQALHLMNQQHTKSKISSAELHSFTQELSWVILQIDVISYIAHGHKAYNKNDVLTANAFYKKAQTALLKSSHPDERRARLIKQVADLLFGRRKSIDEDLMPETEFNPDLLQNSQGISAIADDTAGSEEVDVMNLLAKKQAEATNHTSPN